MGVSVSRKIRAIAPWVFFALKVTASAFFIYYYYPVYPRLMYIADGPARGIEAFDLAFNRFRVFIPSQMLPLPLWIWAAALRLVPDVYWTGMALNVAFAAGTTLFLYLLGERVAGPFAGALAAVLFIFTPLFHNVTLAPGMVDPAFYFWLAAGTWLAARAAPGKRGLVGAAWCYAAAALCRYEGIFVVGAFYLYVLVRRRPARAAAWLSVAIPFAIVGVIYGHKFLGTITPAGRGGGWLIIPALRSDMEPVLPNFKWYKRLFYGFYRLWFDGRAAAAFAVAGAFLVWLRRFRDEGKLVMWAVPAVLFVGVTVVVTVFGTGLCPERYFGSALALLLPFAGLAVKELWRVAQPRWATAAVAIGLAGAAAYTVHYTRVITDYGYGLPGPCGTCAVYESEAALTFRRLWKEGRLKPDEKVYMEDNEDNYSNYVIRAFSDHPLNFEVRPAAEVRKCLPGLIKLMKGCGFRVAVLCNAPTTAAVRAYYPTYKKKAIIYEVPFGVIIVRLGTWEGTPPDFGGIRVY